MRPNVGETICGRVRIDAEVPPFDGAHAFGPTLSAHTLDDNQRLWLTVIERDLVPSARDLSRFMAGAHGLLGMRHPALVPVELVDREADFCVVGCQAIAGAESLTSIIDIGGGPGIADRIAVELARALAFLHAEKRTHGVLSPGNVLVTKGKPILAQHGIAEQCDAARFAARTRKLGVDVVAPEVKGGEPLSPRADVYAWGAVVAAMLSGLDGADAVAAVESGEAGSGPLVLIVREAIISEVDARVPDAIELLHRLADPGLARGRFAAIRDLAERYLDELELAVVQRDEPEPAPPGPDPLGAPTAYQLGSLTPPEGMQLGEAWAPSPTHSPATAPIDVALEAEAPLLTVPPPDEDDDWDFEHAGGDQLVELGAAVDPSQPVSLDDDTMLVDEPDFFDRTQPAFPAPNTGRTTPVSMPIMPATGTMPVPLLDAASRTPPTPIATSYPPPRPVSQTMPAPPPRPTAQTMPSPGSYSQHRTTSQTMPAPSISRHPTPQQNTAAISGTVSSSARIEASASGSIVSAGPPSIDDDARELDLALTLDAPAPPPPPAPQADLALDDDLLEPEPPPPAPPPRPEPPKPPPQPPPQERRIELDLPTQPAARPPTGAASAPIVVVTPHVAARGPKGPAMAALLFVAVTLLAVGLTLPVAKHRGGLAALLGRAEPAVLEDSPAEAEPDTPPPDAKRSVVPPPPATRECPQDTLPISETTCVEAGEYPGLREVPRVDVTLEQARTLCVERGRRLCTADEWLRACGGPSRAAFPYGPAHRADTCNEARRDGVGQNLSRSGARDGCVSPDGAYDLVGNVGEWVDDGTIRGGDANSKNPSCSSKQSPRPNHAGRSTGLRCCVDR